MYERKGVFVMKKYEKIFVLSDIHGHYAGVEAAAKICSSTSPLFILGDLFDHLYGQENLIIDKILELSLKKSCYFIIGNHDIIIDIGLHQIFDPNLTLSSLTKKSNKKKFKIFATIFSANFFEQFETIRQELINSRCDLATRLNNYYKQITKLVHEPEYMERYIKLQQLLTLGIKEYELEINGKCILLTHSGVANDPSSRNSVKPNYRLAEKYDYGVMGHLTIPFVEQMIDEEGDMISFKNFEYHTELDGIRLTGQYLYNHYSKQILIDDGTHANLVVVERK